MIEKRIANLEGQELIDYQRLKEKSRNPQTIQKFKRLEETQSQRTGRACRQKKSPPSGSIKNLSKI